MAGMHIVTHHGPKTFKAEEKILGGQIVEAGTDGVKVATVDSTKVLGVAIIDAQPKTAPVDGVLVAKPEHTSVAYSGMEIELETTAALSLGAKVGADDGGKAKAHSAGDVVGIVTRVISDTRALVRLS